MVNGEVRQDADLSELIWFAPETISILSRSMTLKPGDLISRHAGRRRSHGGR
ncbi:fumarylacetoacetate hydrolase family protein [Rhizobium leguminosarum]|uniref:fumarylacetoacetate hydrolase family protein n=1 Tax=Rhizobium leguminosarum TaxID=384 RepID=UPI003D7C2A83